MNSHPNDQLNSKSQSDAYLRLAMGLKQFQKQMRGELKTLEGAIQATQEAQVEPLVERLSRLENLLLLDEGWDRIRERLVRLEQTVEKQNRTIESQQEIIREQNQQLGECNAVISGLDGKLKDLLPLPDRLQHIQSQLDACQQQLDPVRDATTTHLPEQIQTLKQALEDLKTFQPRIESLEGLKQLPDRLVQIRNQLESDFDALRPLRTLAENPEALESLMNFKDKVIEIVNIKEVWQRIIKNEEKQEGLGERVRLAEDKVSLINALGERFDLLESRIEKFDPLISLKDELADLSDRLQQHRELFSSLEPLAENPSVLDSLNDFSTRIIDIVNTKEIWEHIHKAGESEQKLIPRLETIEKQTERLESLEALKPLQDQVQQIQSEIKECGLRFEPLRNLAENAQVVEPLFNFSDRVLEIVNTREIWETLQNLKEVKSIVDEQQGAIAVLGDISDRIDRLQSNMDERLKDLGWVEQLRLLPDQLINIQKDYSQHLEVEHIQSQDIHAGIIPIQHRIDSIAKDFENWHEAFQKRLEELGGQMDLKEEQIQALQQLRADLLGDVEELKKVKASARLGRVERSLRQLERLLDVQTVMAFFEKSQRLLLEDKS